MNPLGADADLRMSEREGVFVGGRGVKLHYRSHRVESAPFRAAIAVVESTENRGRLYAELVRLLAPSGYVLYGCAHREHRRVPGQTGFLEEWNDLYEELNAFIGLVGTQEPDAPLFLAGAQLAGQLVLTFALHQPEKLHGVVAIQPRLHQSKTPRSLVSLSKTLARIWPAFTPADNVDPALEPDTTMPEMFTTSPRVEIPPSQVVLADALASEITIPVFVVDGHPPAAPGTGQGDLQDTDVHRPSLSDVELWLDRILTTPTV